MHYSVEKKSMRARMDKTGILYRFRTRFLFVSMAVAVWWLFFVVRFVSEGGPATTVSAGQLQKGDIPYHKREQALSLQGLDHRIKEKFASRDALSKAEDGTGADTCEGKYIYLLDLPREYNEALLEDCESSVLLSQLCNDMVNMGFGEPMEETGGVFSKTGWYTTNQFALEVIFHHKVKHYRCRTMDSSRANAIFVPFYSGMEVGPHLNMFEDLWEGATVSHRDQVPRAFADWLTSRPEWSRLDGHDHFFVGGRVTWDFRRTTDDESDWGNNLLLLEPVKNMTTLTIEASPWHLEDVGVPYPTYFHPSTDQEVFDWQDRVAKLERKSLFCFAGAPRPKQDISIRGQLMAHCKESEYCNLLECTKFAGKCHEPANVMRLFKESHFCLQPAGDSYTRRSIFDSILSGCIPVFFHRYSAYTQYGWFFPANQSSYSVFIDEEFIRAGNESIEAVLRRYSAEDIQAMREVVISLIPRILYSNPVNSDMTLTDAFELSVNGVLDRIRDYKRGLEAEKEKENVRKEAIRRNSARKAIGEAKKKLDSMLRRATRKR